MTWVGVTVKLEKRGTSVTERWHPELAALGEVPTRVLMQKLLLSVTWASSSSGESAAPPAQGFEWLKKQSMVSPSTSAGATECASSDHNETWKGVRSKASEEATPLIKGSANVRQHIGTISSKNALT